VEALESRWLLATTPITVGNPSFEQGAGPDNGPIGIAVWQISGTVGNAYNPPEAAYNNGTDTGSTGGNLDAPGEGRQVLFVEGANAATQELGDDVVAGTSYSLTVAIGNRKDLTMENFLVSLFAGANVIAEQQGDGEALAPTGGFANVTLTSPPIDAESPAVGQPLRIELRNLASKGGQAFQVNFDNVRLSAITPDADTTPPTASITPPVVQSGTAFTDFDVLFSDDVGLDTETIQGNDLVVTGPAGAQAPLIVTLENTTGTFGGPSSTATFRIQAPGGTWDAPDSGKYTIAFNGAVFDTSGNRAAPVTATFNVDIAAPDTQPPTAVLVPPPAATLGQTQYAFAVNYTDNVGFSPNTANNTQIRVTGPNGFDQLATFQGADDDAGANRTYRYAIVPPGGSFDPGDNGTYAVSSVGPNAVKDSSGNAVPDGQMGTFNVSLTVGAPGGPTAEYITDQGTPQFGDATYDFRIRYTDAQGVNAATIDGNDIVVSGPNGFSAAASFVSGGVMNLPEVDATYRITAPGGSWDLSDNGTYNFALQPGAVVDVQGVPSDGGNIPGNFTLNFPTPVVGGLDPTFGGGTGVVSFDPPGPPLKTTDVIGLEDGSTVAVAFTVASLGGADVSLFRTLPTGFLDTDFGGSGTGLVSVDAGGDDRASTVVRLPDGKFLVAGTTSKYVGATESDADFFLARFNSNGTVDTTFGINGVAIGDFGNTSLDRGNDLVVLPDGRIVVFGQSTFAHADGDFALARFSAGGVFDTSFGTSGRVVTDLGGVDRVNAVTLAPDGGFVAAGSTSSGNTGTFAIVRYNADGSLFNAWGPNGNGSLLVDFLPGLDEAQSIVAQADGKMVAGGLATTGDPDAAGFDSSFAAIRIDGSGNLDPSFGSGGKVVTDFNGLASINKLILQPGGKVVASGEVVGTLSDVGIASVRVALARYNADGTLDANFSDDGKLVIDFEAIEGGGTASLTAALTAQANEPLSDLEAKFEQFRQESQGLVAITKGGAILALATQGAEVEIARVIGDAGAPSLFIALIPNISEIDVTSSTFVVRYVDDLAVDVSRLGTGDIRVTGPNGFNELAEFVDIVEGNTNGAERTVRYRVKPPGASFVKSDEGTYSLAVEPNRIADINGNTLQSGAIPGATFTVTIPENEANLRVDTPLTGKFPASVVGGAKASGGAVRVSNTGVLDAKTTLAVTLFASTDAELDEATDTQVAVINGVKVALKPGQSKAVKLKFTKFPSNLADGQYFLIARLDGGNVLPELKESDNNAATAAPITIAAPFVDLSGTPVSITGTPVPGGKATASVLIRNAGNVPAKATVPVQLLASPGDQTVGNGDIPVATPSAKLNLKANASKPTKLPFVVPLTGLPPGTYTLLAVLDSSNALPEKDEGNNLVVLGQFTV
jgi:uncharacterized delta-60 repeat protein